MAEYQVRVVLPYTSGLPSDVVVNTWSVIYSGSADLAPIFAAMYDGTAGSIGGWISERVSRVADACRVETYEIDLAGGPMGAPLGVSTFTMEAADSAAFLPLEVAVCTSFSANAGPGISAARRRGRVFIGPLIPTVVDGTDGAPRVSDTFRDALALATKNIAVNLVAEGAELAVWSRTDAALYPIVRGWVDNEFDTMRSRQIEATDRTSWVL